MEFNSQLVATINQLNVADISRERQEVLQPLIKYIQAKVSAGEPVNLNFICTHNSRRSQFSQIWAQTAVLCYRA